MHGYGYPPEQSPRRRPSSAVLTSLRVLFVALTVLSCGLLAWGAMLRLAVVTRKGLDWALLVLVFALNVGLFAFILATPDDPDKMTDAQALIGVAWLFGVMIGVVAYYLYADIRHFGPSGPYGGPHHGLSTAGSVAGPYGGYVPPQVPAVTPATPTPGYGYPPSAHRTSAHRAPATPQPVTPPPAPRVPAHRPPVPRAPASPPTPGPASALPASPQPASPQRLDEVRAELDELSDYLRKEGGNR